MQRLCQRLNGLHGWDARILFIAGDLLGGGVYPLRQLSLGEVVLQAVQPQVLAQHVCCAPFLVLQLSYRTWVGVRKGGGGVWRAESGEISRCRVFGSGVHRVG